MSSSPSSEAPTPPWGIRMETTRNDGVERLQTRLLQIGLSLVAVVVLGGGAGVLAVATKPSLALVVSVCVVVGCVLAVLVALAAAISATRKVRPVAVPAQRRPVAQPQPQPQPQAPQPAPVEVVEVVTRDPEPAPLWAHPGEPGSAISNDPAQRREVFVKLARRLQSLINRAIKRIDELEQENEDPVLLDGLYEIDHLFTLARRQGENLAVLGGEAPQRRSNRPVSVYAVLLAAVSEAEHYRQIAIVPVEDVEIHGHAVAEIIHLLAELLENATRFTSPDGPKVEVRAQKVTAGLAIEVQDRGLGMSYEDLEQINRLLDGSTRIDISDLLSDGRIGLAVVRELARRHDIKVRLQSNIFGGVAAAVVIPKNLLSESASAPTPTARRRQQPAPTRREARPEPAAIGASTAPPASPATASSPRMSPVPAAEVSSSRLSQVGANDSSSRLTPASPVASAQIPTTQVPPSPGLGPIPPSRPSGRRHRVEEPPEQPVDHGDPLGGEDELPKLPQRAPGRSYDDLRLGGNGIVEDIPNGESAGRRPPPLPQRRGTHLREELLEPPSHTTPVPGHNTRLMASVQEGREHWFAEQKRDSTPQQPNHGTSRGDSTQWPTT